MTRSKNASRNLGKAPLIEAIFELRWFLESRSTDRNDPFSLFDPAYHILEKNFSEKIKKVGYRHKFRPITDNFLMPYSVESRHYLAPDKKFPLMQLGLGIFATNTDGGLYDWSSFKAQIVQGVKTLLESYPEPFHIKPTHIELRYSNIFSSSSNTALKRNSSLIEFINKITNSKMSLPDLPKEVEAFSGGKFTLKASVKNKKNTDFWIDIADGNTPIDKIFRLENKVITADQVGLPKSVADLNNIGTWVTHAHSILSPFFEGFIKQDVLKQFR